VLSRFLSPAPQSVRWSATRIHPGCDHPEPHSCALSIVAIDGKSLPSPRKQVSLSPGRHHLSIRVWLGMREGIVHADAPLDHSFKTHHYWIDGEMSKSGLFKLLVEDEDERPLGVKRQKTK